MPITEFFIAPDDAAAGDVVDSGPASLFPHLDVELAAFIALPGLARITGLELDASAQDGPLAMGEEGIVEQIDPAMTSALGSISDGDLADVAARWADPGQGFEADEATSTLAGLVPLARDAQSRGWTLYVWSSP